MGPHQSAVEITQDLLLDVAAALLDTKVKTAEVRLARKRLLNVNKTGLRVAQISWKSMFKEYS